MEISVSQQNDITVLALQGRLDGVASLPLEQRLDALLASGVRKVVVDCAALTYVSSAGLRVFLGGAKKLKSAGGRVAFAALTPAVHEVFELSGFLEILAVHPSTAAASASLA
ncbi:MAG: hypothetical protein RLZZ447_1107 [Verrucomicrobiota bacterium]|jgi:anti-anti-sigma factor